MIGQGWGGWEEGEREGGREGGGKTYAYMSSLSRMCVSDSRLS